ncbi:MAG: XrtA system polysaccharide deacetylase [Acidobacteriaceae bacterium]
MPETQLHGLSVDVEDYFHVEAFTSQITPDSWPDFPSRVVSNTRKLLELFARFDAHGTFFVLGWVAERYPEIVREISAAGHEIGCHSFLHRRIHRLTPDEFRADTRRAVAAIEYACGERPVAYRAPTFSIVRKTLWAIPILAEEGFLYDSSVYPVLHDLYGIPSAPRFPFRWQIDDSKTLCEIPPMTVRVFGRNFPACGGGSLRNLPMWFHRWAARRIVESDRRPILIYLHPWEIDPQQPRIAAPLKSRLRHYRNIEQMQARLSELLRGRKFVPLGTILQSCISTGELPPQPLFQ